MRNEYATIGAAIANSSNPNMLFGVWSGGLGKPWKWAAEVGGNYWRTTTDIYNDWDSVLHNFDVTYSIPGIDRYTAPGHYTFLDQMVVGVVPNRSASIHGPGLTDVEMVSHLSMWVTCIVPLSSSDFAVFD